MLPTLRSLLAALVLLLLAITPAFAELTQLADKVYAYVGGKDASAAASFAANAGIVIGRDGVLVVDTLVSAKEGERFLADIRKLTDKPIRYVVNTHTHLDHAFGNCVFARLGATVISQQADREMLAQAGAEVLKNAANFGLTPEQMAGTEIVLPSLTFETRMTIDLGDESIELIRTAPSHTAGSTVVYLPSEKLLFAGDILFTDFHPYLADGNLAGWTRTLDELLAMDVEKIVPGHGPLSTKQDLREMKAYLALFDARAQALAASGLDAEAIASELLKALPPRSLGAWMVAFNLKSRYLPRP
jgi:glyoxylase-like metal-dependent hydrolase (beta-lactamase superfamily II)